MQIKHLWGWKWRAEASELGYWLTRWGVEVSSIGLVEVGILAVDGEFNGGADGIFLRGYDVVLVADF